MNDLELSKDEQCVLRIIAQQGGVCPTNYPNSTFAGCVHSLERKGLVRGAYVEGGGVEDARLTDEGRMLLATNPNLRNPIDWKWTITTIIAVVAALAAIAALFVACTR